MVQFSGSRSKKRGVKWSRAHEYNTEYLFPFGIRLLLMFFTDPAKFAEWFDRKYPGIYRNIDAEDTKVMTSCGLICRYHGYNTS
jgi:hypothetical protein